MEEKESLQLKQRRNYLMADVCLILNDILMDYSIISPALVACKYKELKKCDLEAELMDMDIDLFDIVENCCSRNYLVVRHGSESCFVRKDHVDHSVQHKPFLLFNYNAQPKRIEYKDEDDCTFQKSVEKEAIPLPYEPISSSKSAIPLPEKSISSSTSAIPLPEESMSTSEIAVPLSQINSVSDSDISSKQDNKQADSGVKQEIVVDAVVDLSSQKFASNPSADKSKVSAIRELNWEEEENQPEAVKLQPAVDSFGLPIDVEPATAVFAVGAPCFSSRCEIPLSASGVSKLDAGKNPGEVIAPKRRLFKKDRVEVGIKPEKVIPSSVILANEESLSIANASLKNVSTKKVPQHYILHDDRIADYEDVFARKSELAEKSMKSLKWDSFCAKVGSQDIAAVMETLYNLNALQSGGSYTAEQLCDLETSLAKNGSHFGMKSAFTSFALLLDCGLLVTTGDRFEVAQEVLQKIVVLRKNFTSNVYRFLKEQGRVTVGQLMERSMDFVPVGVPISAASVVRLVNCYPLLFSLISCKENDYRVMDAFISLNDSVPDFLVILDAESNSVKEAICDCCDCSC